MKTKWMIAGLVALCGMAQAGFVTIGNAGNAADTTGYGAVGYTYQISQYEVTGAEFGSAVASDSHIGLSTPNSGNNPAAYVSWLEAAKYCNWLTTGDAYLGAYQFDGSGNLTGVDRAAAIMAHGIVYALPTEDEWYKAAYFKPDASGYSLYANGTATAPVKLVDSVYNYSFPWDVGHGKMEQNGTYDMMGNVWEWNESAFDGTLDNMSEYRTVRGGGFSHVVDNLRSTTRNPGDPTGETYYVGFRVVAVNVIPEPATALSLALGGLLIVGYRRMRKSYGHF